MVESAAGKVLKDELRAAYGESLDHMRRVASDDADLVFTCGYPSRRAQDVAASIIPAKLLAPPEEVRMRRLEGC